LSYQLEFFKIKVIHFCSLSKGSPRLGLPKTRNGTPERNDY
jgi:hypothetical protein